MKQKELKNFILSKVNKAKWVDLEDSCILDVEGCDIGISIKEDSLILKDDEICTIPITDDFKVCFCLGEHLSRYYDSGTIQ